jgi:protein-disulfide isomerase
MICLIALVVFGILGIFSANYRVIAREAAECVFRRVTLRKCETGLDKRLKNQVTGKLARKNPKLGRFLFKYFEVFSWIMILLLAWSVYEIGVGVHNLAVYGSCVAPGETGICPFTIRGAYSEHVTTYPEVPVAPVPGNDPGIGLVDAKVTVIIFGCYTCPYTTIANPLIEETITEYSDRVRFVFKDFPILEHRSSFESAWAAQCAYEQDAYFGMRHELFERQNNLITYEHYYALARELGLDDGEFRECFTSNETEQEVVRRLDEGINAHVRGTPTYFVNGEKITGSSQRDINTLRRLIDIKLGE